MCAILEEYGYMYYYEEATSASDCQPSLIEIESCYE